MAKEYIEREKMLLQVDLHGTNKFGMLDEDIREFIKKQSAADVVEVVRCRDCKHLETVVDIIGDMYCFCGNADGKYITEVDLDDFCSHGEKREEVENGYSKSILR